MRNEAEDNRKNVGGSLESLNTNGSVIFVAIPPLDD